MTPDELIARARSPIGLKTLYWLGQGGTDPDSPVPGSWTTIRQMINELTVTAPKQVPLLKSIAIDAGYPSSRWDEPVRACDCSGFSNWVVGVVRGGIGLAYIWTQTMYDYSLQRVEEIFERIDEARVGSLVVYPPGRRGEEHGHVGIVTEAAAGAATRVVHCSSTNFRYYGNHDAIEETGPEVFEYHAPLRYLWPRVLGSAQPGGDA